MTISPRPTIGTSPSALAGPTGAWCPRMKHPSEPRSAVRYPVCRVNYHAVPNLDRWIDILFGL